MHAADILTQTDHRPWPLPTGSWVMAQTWHDLLFIHWPVPAAQLQPYVPAGLTLDTFERRAWVGVVPFRMSNIHPRGLPPVRGFDAFPELNVRTYVTDGQKPGVLFLSLDAANAVAVTVARRAFHLPYFRAQMLQEGPNYSSHRMHSGAPPGDFVARYEPVGAVYHATPGTIDYWLTERYCLYTTNGRGDLLRCEIHHRPWPLQPATLELVRNEMVEPFGIYLPDEPPLLHFARQLEVVVWWPQRVALANP